MIERYQIYKIDDFYELFDIEERITLFANIDLAEVEQARQYYEEYGCISEEV